MLKPDVTTAWYIATDIVPTIDNAPSLVSNPKIINQLPYISEYAAIYDKKIGNGNPRGFTKAFAKF